MPALDTSSTEDAAPSSTTTAPSGSVAATTVASVLASSGPAGLAVGSKVATEPQWSGARRPSATAASAPSTSSSAPASDIDIAILPGAPLEPGTLARIRDALDESTIPYEVEVIDLSSVDESFRRKVLAEAIAWNG